MLKKSDNMSNLLGRKTETRVAGAVGQGELPEVTSFHELGLGYESFATVGEIRVWWRADFQSGSRVLKKVF